MFSSVPLPAGTLFRLFVVCLRFCFPWRWDVLQCWRSEESTSEVCGLCNYEQSLYKPNDQILSKSPSWRTFCTQTTHSELSGNTNSIQHHWQEATKPVMEGWWASGKGYLSVFFFLPLHTSLVLLSHFVWRRKKNRAFQSQCILGIRGFKLPNWDLRELTRRRSWLPSLA